MYNTFISTSFGLCGLFSVFKNLNFRCGACILYLCLETVCYVWTILYLCLETVCSVWTILYLCLETVCSVWIILRFGNSYENLSNYLLLSSLRSSHRQIR